MKSKLMLVSVVTATLFLLAACSPASKEASVDIPCRDFIIDPHISQQMEVTIDSSLTVTLCSNPTTGFRWSESAQISDQTVLQQTDHKFEPLEGGASGADGQEIWTFKALKKGTSITSMKYSRPWEGGEKGKCTFTLTVVVK